MWETIEADKPDLWNELKSDDIDAMIDELVEYKKALPRRHAADSHLRQHPAWDASCRMAGSRRAWGGFTWEMELYGLVRTGERRKRSAIFRRLVFRVPRR